VTSEGLRVYPEELAATAIYLALCVDANMSSMRPNTGSKKWKFDLPVYWKIDIYTLIKTLARHRVISEKDIDDERVFYMVRNGYTQLRRLLKKKKHYSLENLVTTITKSKTILEKFCREYPREAEKYILKEIREKHKYTYMV